MTRVEYFVLETNHYNLEGGTIATQYENNNTGLSARFVEGRTFTLDQVDRNCFVLEEVGVGTKIRLFAHEEDFVGRNAWGYFERKTSQGRVTGSAVKVLSDGSMFIALVPVGCPLQAEPHKAVLPK